MDQVISLNFNAAAAVVVNGVQAKTFRLQRSVRQACPLAPYLFLLTIDVLGQMLQHPACGVQGLRLPDNTAITNQMFADDMLLLLDGTKDNMDRAFIVINRFGAASGAKLNLHKSVGLWLAPTERDWEWGETEGLKWLLPGEVTRYLGYPFGLRIPQQEKDSKMLSQLRKHLFKWSNQNLSLAGRIMIANQVVLSSIWYLASCTDLSSKALKLARALVRNYIWSGRRDSSPRARVRWDTTVLPIVHIGIKILDPQWQTSALMVKLLIRGLSVGYEPWKVFIRYRVAQTKQSRRGNWPSNANWIMNSRTLVRQGSAMWQGIMKAWSTLQSGLEQQDPTSWSQNVRQPVFGNRMLTNEIGVQWGTDPNTTMGWWPGRNLRSLQDMTRPDGHGWKIFEEQWSFCRNPATAKFYARVRASIPWEATPASGPTIGQWLAPKEADGLIKRVLHVTNTTPLQATLYHKDWTEQLQEIKHQHSPTDEQLQEVRVIQCGGPRRTVLAINPTKTPAKDHTLWSWENDWVKNLEWDPKDWQWRRIGVLAKTSILNYTTKRGYRVALRQNNHTMRVDAELEAAGYNSKERAKFFNRIWHPHLPRKVYAMQ